MKFDEHWYLCVALCKLFQMHRVDDLILQKFRKVYFTDEIQILLYTVSKIEAYSE